MPVEFHFQKVAQIKEAKRLKEFIPLIFKAEKKVMDSIEFVFCSDAYLLKINRDFLNHDYYTDIITFDMTDTSSNAISAEIYISLEMVRTNAREFKVSSIQELHRVIFHGVLHLCGYGDKSNRQKEQMRKKEDFYLNMFHGEH